MPPSGLGVLTRSVVIRSAADLEQLRGVEVLVGTLTITSSDVTAADLETLSSLRRIHGNLNVMHNDRLETLDGLRSLTGVQGSLDVGANPSLNSVAGLGKLELIGNNVRFSGNPKLENLKGLERAQFYAALSLTHDGAASLEGLRSDGYPFELTISNNPRLKSLQGLPPSFLAAATITENPELESLSGLEGATDIMTMTLERNPKLRDASAIAGASVDRLTVRGNASLAQADVEALVESLKLRNSTLAAWLEHGEPSASFMPSVTVAPIPPREDFGPRPPPINPIAPEEIAPAEWTFFTYLNADNNLENFGKDDLNEMEAVGSQTGKLNVIALVDGGAMTGDGWAKHTRLMYITPDDANSQSIISREIVVPPDTTLGQLLNGMGGEANMGDPRLLRAAIEFVQSRIPSQKFLLNLWDHGDGWRSNSHDDTSNDWLDFPSGEGRAALAKLPISIYSADACLNSTLDLADLAGLNEGTYLVGSQEVEPGEGWNYTKVLSTAPRKQVID